MFAGIVSLTSKETPLRTLHLLLEASGDADRPAHLAGFLAACAHSLSQQPTEDTEPVPEAFSRARDTFVRAGLNALAASQREIANDWVQVGIHSLEGVSRYAELCVRVASVARRLLTESQADNFFFMNKPPGMRLRFQAAAGFDPAELAGILNRELANWRDEGLIDSIERGVYEPESQLFGGPRSMDFVHALFTVDSLFWLDYHGQSTAGTGTITPAWLVSLAVLQPVFAGLNINGWEDLGVWSGIRDRGGRQLATDEASLPIYAGVAAQIVDVWSRRNRIGDELSASIQAILAEYDSALLAGAAQWRSGYFSQPGASLGPRAAAGFYVIFHWNRAALTPIQQALLAESLSERVYENVGK